MKNGVLREDEGYDLLVDGVVRTFADLTGNAFAAARELKLLNPGSIIEIRDRSSGRKLMMLPDGRTY